MNRQTKRLLQRQGQLEADGTPSTKRPAPASPSGARRQPEAKRDSLFRRIGTYLREVRGELAKVLWPRRSEVVNYSTVVLGALVVLALLIFGLNFVFAKFIFFLYST